MDKEHFEILLEKIDSNVELLVEAFAGVNGRLDRADSERGRLFDLQEKTHLRLRVLEQGQAKLEQGQAKLEQGQAKLEQGLAGVERGLVEVRDELRGTRHTVGLLHTVANTHETRLQDVENALKDHLDGHG